MSNFDLGLTVNDLKRMVWAAVFAALAAYSAGVHDVKALWAAAVAGALSMIKNGLLADGSRFKG